MSTDGAKTGFREKVTTKRRVIEKSVVLFAGSNRAPRTHERVSKYQRAEANCDRRASRVAARDSMPEPGIRTPIAARPRNFRDFITRQKSDEKSDVAGKVDCFSPKDVHVYTCIRSPSSRA